jgi:hypothetical protein
VAGAGAEPDATVAVGSGTAGTELDVPATVVARRTTVRVTRVADAVTAVTTPVTPTASATAASVMRRIVSVPRSRLRTRSSWASASISAQDSGRG